MSLYHHVSRVTYKYCRLPRRPVCLLAAFKSLFSRIFCLAIFPRPNKYVRISPLNFYVHRDGPSPGEGNDILGFVCSLPLLSNALLPSVVFQVPQRYVQCQAVLSRWTLFIEQRFLSLFLKFRTFAKSAGNKILSTSGVEGQSMWASGRQRLPGRAPSGQPGSHLHTP